jgi:hypothetical protein
MATESASLYTFATGVVDRRGLSRVEVRRLSLAAQTQTNWVSRVLGRMSLRPGLKYVGGIAGNPDLAPSASVAGRAELFMLADGAGAARAAAAGSASIAVGAHAFPRGAADGSAAIVVAATGVGSA